MPLLAADMAAKSERLEGGTGVCQMGERADAHIFTTQLGRLRSAAGRWFK